MLIVKSYEPYNHRRYGSPWVCRVAADTTLDFSAHVGRYTGYNGSEGDLIIHSPVEGQVYAYGQKDYRGNNSGYQYIQYLNGEAVPVERKNLIAAIEGGERNG